jgi:hypothetical protein
MGSRKAWPAWARATLSQPAKGLVPNPPFGKLLRVQAQRVVCDRLKLDQAVGLSAVEISGMTFDQESDAEKQERVLDWFDKRGAIRPAAKKSSSKQSAVKRSGVRSVAARPTKSLKS